jgi:hypothetical protein
VTVTGGVLPAPHAESTDSPRHGELSLRVRGIVRVALVDFVALCPDAARCPSPPCHFDLVVDPGGVCNVQPFLSIWPFDSYPGFDIVVSTLAFGATLFSICHLVPRYRLFLKRLYFRVTIAGAERHRERYGDTLVLFLPPAQCKHGVTQWAGGVKMYA